MNYPKYSQQDYIEKRRKAQRSAAIARCALVTASAAVSIYIAASVVIWLVGVFS